MAVEAFTIHDGLQAAAADYRNSTFSGTTRLGPSGSAQFLAVRLSTSLERTVGLTTADGAPVHGILQNKPSSGIAADVTVFGMTKAVAGSTAIGAGMDLMASSSGAMIPFSAGANVQRIGRSYEAPATFGQIFSMYLFAGGGGVGTTA